MAARQGQPRSHCLPRRRKRLRRPTTAHLQPLREQIFGEIKARTKETDLSVPTRQGDWWYFSRTYAGKQYRVQCRCPITDPDDWDPPILDENTEIPDEQILLDSNAEADGHDFFALGAALVSLDANLLAYSVDTVGDERYTLRFKDLRTGEKLPDEIADISAGLPGLPITAPCTTRPWTPPIAPTRCGGIGWAPASLRNWCTTKPTNDFGSGWGSPAARRT